MERKKSFLRLLLVFLALAVPSAVGIVVLRRSNPPPDSHVGGRLPADASRRSQEGTPFHPADESDSRASTDALGSQDQPEDSSDMPEELAQYGMHGARSVKFGSLAWTPGLKWKVETHYRTMQNGAGDGWGQKPILWQFEVKATEKMDGRDVWVVSIEPSDLAGLPYNPGGTAYIAMDDHSVVAVRDRVQERGSVRERFLKFDDEDGAPSVLFPVDMPPPGTAGRERASASGTPPANPFRRDPTATPPKSSGTVVDVEFEKEGGTLRQRWDSTVPYWPLYSATPSRVSYLRTEP